MVDWIEQWHHDITDVSRLPLPEELEHPPCMVDRRPSAARRRARQVAPASRLRDCCDYHGQDWAAASEAAIRLLSRATAEGLTGEELAERVIALAVAEGTGDRDVEAIRCLVSTVDPLMLDDDGGIYEGRHRIQAMIDQGVRRTVLVRLVLIDPTTGQPA
ncbi:hypothetical protein [Polymorphospora sp. NPDC050346]|uniref:hypothetical protein n=1 Tax=Polymorphospora sp. NPDC050346 TaxID=3155780 RepID=UPI0033D0A392